MGLNDIYVISIQPHSPPTLKTMDVGYIGSLCGAGEILVPGVRCNAAGSLNRRPNHVLNDVI